MVGCFSGGGEGSDLCVEEDGGWVGQEPEKADKRKNRRLLRKAKLLRN